MDPQARRHMWDVVEEISALSSVVLTTHSMEEADALCAKIGIMRAGKLACLGTRQQLKGRYGNGYLLELSTRDLEPSPKQVSHTQPCAAAEAELLSSGTPSKPEGARMPHAA